MLFQATLIKITDFKQLIFQISETTYLSLRDKIDQKNIWIFDTEPTVSAPDGEERFYAKILLDRFDKAIIEKKFDPLVKKVCMVTANVEKFTPQKSACALSSGEEIKFLRLKKCVALKQQAPEERMRSSRCDDDACFHMEIAQDNRPAQDKIRYLLTKVNAAQVRDAVLDNLDPMPEDRRNRVRKEYPEADSDDDAELDDDDPPEERMPIDPEASKREEIITLLKSLRHLSPSEESIITDGVMIDGVFDGHESDLTKGEWDRVHAIVEKVKAERAAEFLDDIKRRKAKGRREAREAAFAKEIVAAAWKRDAEELSQKMEAAADEGHDESRRAVELSPEEEAAADEGHDESRASADELSQEIEEKVHALRGMSFEELRKMEQDIEDKIQKKAHRGEELTEAEGEILTAGINRRFARFDLKFQGQLPLGATEPTIVALMEDDREAAADEARPQEHAVSESIAKLREHIRPGGPKLSDAEYSHAIAAVKAHYRRQAGVSQNGVVADAETPAYWVPSLSTMSVIAHTSQ